VVHVSAHGFWLFLEGLERELYLPFSQFPWFADATIRQLSGVEVERGHILRWPELDVDLDVSRIGHPERYPLVSGATASRQKRRQPAVASRHPRSPGRPSTSKSG
jgi:hypothetical protein